MIKDMGLGFFELDTGDMFGCAKFMINVL